MYKALFKKSFYTSKPEHVFTLVYKEHFDIRIFRPRKTYYYSNDSNKLNLYFKKRSRLDLYENFCRNPTIVLRWMKLKNFIFSFFFYYIKNNENYEKYWNKFKCLQVRYCVRLKNKKKIYFYERIAKYSFFFCIQFLI